MGMNADDSDGPFIEAPEEVRTDAERDAERAPADQWPLGAFPRGVDGRQKKYQVVFRRAVLNDIRAHGCSSPEVEVCGVLVGSVYRDGDASWCYIEANIRGNYASGRDTQVTFTSETWTHIHEQMDRRFSGMRIVGWYHTHPGFGIFLSDMDVFIQQNFFGEPWQLAFVDDPRGGDRGVFVWRSGVPVREPHLVKEDVPDESPLAGEVKSRGWFRRWAGLTLAIALTCAPPVAALAWWWRN
jgi:proteasome lid subunit RPN8/RPN11